MPNIIKKIQTNDFESFPYIFQKNIDIPLKTDITGGNIVRANVYRPKSSERFPVLITYGPYGKDIHYKDFHPNSYKEVDNEQYSDHAAWEVPSPTYWTKQGYVIIRVDERGSGQSPGILDTMSRGTSEAFYDVIEWAAEQSWSSGNVGLLGISYFGGSQWRVAARRPKGLKAIIPWEGMSDYYRDRVRHGGILSNGFISFWWNRQVLSNQYGLPGRNARDWGEDTIEGDLDEEELIANRRDQTIDTANHIYLDDDYYKLKEFNLEDIEVPLLSVANWGGIMLHLRGNIEGYNHAGSRNKYLRTIVGRHDLPFYYKENVAMQKSFLDAFLKGEDRDGWSTGKMPKVEILLRKGNVGYNNPTGEKKFSTRIENEWPISRTQYTKYYLASDRSLSPNQSGKVETTSMSYKTLSTLESPDAIQFITQPFEKEVEITGHITSQLNISVDDEDVSPSDIDIFVTLRHLDKDSKEILYTGTAGDPVPLCKGYLRVSHRKIQESHPWNRPYLPYRTYASADSLEVKPENVYTVIVEIWPTNVVLEVGDKLVFEVSGGDTQGCDRFQHNHPQDRNEKKLGRTNRIHFDSTYENYVILPIIPEK
ncbi:uncharacterized protein AC631_03446 [Debaryomyces fabryi]|uniref:Xaa-Pro dipeptidyl-peptidase C-terminal domain-containing protein n=1 Tax=Debaryomyces fabryi TaxID=58627 RepID=A0A0V1PWY6_9ASCO|nr:uncharacterized protein AC631_03446 [Debaryomyces fabryi]KSA00797.1 hypothetical protein AC631_03446 [Debaryomyces fabryi]CUM55110.1 unnamed protein product [Debaryomyces fabryi]